MLFQKVINAYCMKTETDSFMLSFGGYFTMLSVARLYSIRWWVNDELEMTEGSHGLIQGISQYSSRETKEHHEKPQSE